LRNKHVTGVLGKFTAAATTGTKKKRAHASQWVGLGGFGNSQLLQAGTGMDTARLHWYSLTWTHNAWWEEIQSTGNGKTSDTKMQYVFIVLPGDQMCVQIVQLAKDSYHLTINDTRGSGQTWSKTVKFTPPDNSDSTANVRSAEWIVEKYTILKNDKDTSSSYIFGDFKAVFTNCQYYIGHRMVRMNSGSGVLCKVTFWGDDPSPSLKDKKHVHWVTPSKPGNDNESFTVKSASYK